MATIETGNVDAAEAIVTAGGIQNVDAAVALPSPHYYLRAGSKCVSVKSHHTTNIPMLELGNHTYLYPVTLLKRSDLIRVADILARTSHGVTIGVSSDDADRDSGTVELTAQIIARGAYLKRDTDSKKIANLYDEFSLSLAGSNPLDDLDSAFVNCSNLSITQARVSQLAGVLDLIQGIEPGISNAPILDVLLYTLYKLAGVDDANTSFTDGCLTIRLANQLGFESALTCVPVMAAFTEWLLVQGCIDGITLGLTEAPGRYGAAHGLTSVVIQSSAGATLVSFDITPETGTLADLEAPDTIMADFSTGSRTLVNEDPAVAGMDVSKVWIPPGSLPVGVGVDEANLGIPHPTSVIQVSEGVTLELMTSGVSLYPQLAGQGLALTAMPFLRRADATEDPSEVPAQWGEVDGKYGRYTIKATSTGVDSKGIMNIFSYAVTGPDPVSTTLDSTFKLSAFAQSVRDDIATAIVAVGQQYVRGSDIPAIYTQNVGGGARLQVSVSDLQFFRVEDHDAATTDGVLRLDCEDKVVVCADDDLHITIRVLDSAGKSVVSGTFKLSQWPRLAITDVLANIALTKDAHDLAKSDQAGGAAQGEPGTVIPEGFWSKFFDSLMDFFSSLLGSKWLWIIIALVVLLVLSRNRNSGPQAQTIVIPQPIGLGRTVPAQQRRVANNTNNNSSPMENQDLL